MEGSARIVLGAMSKVLTATYDAEQNVLKLAEPLEGVKDEERVNIVVTKPVDPNRPWLALSGILSKEAGEELAKNIDEMFPPWNE